MSTNMYFVCLDHEPHLWSDAVEHHISQEILSKLRSWMGIRPAFLEVDGIVEYVDYKEQYLNTAVSFFRNHPECRIGLMTEYRKWLDVGYGLPEGAEAHEFKDEEVVREPRRTN